MRTGLKAGFTLIELVVVLAVLAIIAGLVVPQIDFLRRSADKAGGAHSIGAVSSNVQLFRTVTGSYPERFDALIDSTTDTLYTPLSTKVSGAFTVGTLSASPTAATEVSLKSLSDVGITRLMKHSVASFGQKLPGNSGSVEYTLAAGEEVALMNLGSLSGSAASKRDNIVKSIYPAGVPAGVKLLVVGVGQECTAIGKTMQSAPAYSGVDANTTYNRYFLVFAVYDTGKRAQLKGALDSTGDYLTQEVDEFFENKPE